MFNISLGFILILISEAISFSSGYVMTSSLLAEYKGGQEIDLNVSYTTDSDETVIEGDITWILDVFVSPSNLTGDASIDSTQKISPVEVFVEGMS